MLTTELLYLSFLTERAVLLVSSYYFHYLFILSILLAIVQQNIVRNLVGRLLINIYIRYHHTVFFYCREYILIHLCLRVPDIYFSLDFAYYIYYFI